MYQNKSEGDLYVKIILLYLDVKSFRVWPDCSSCLRLEGDIRGRTMEKRWKLAFLLAWQMSLFIC